ncbi:MAG: AMP-binding protein [Flavobacteriaceae bacterium]
MATSQSDIWYPSEQQKAGCNVTLLMERLGLNTYDDLYRLSIEHPDRYWAEILDFCAVQWSKPYEQFADLSRAPEFPKWFVGGEINWVDTIFAFARDPATADKPAVIAEREDGAQSQVTYAELHKRVRKFAGGLKKLGITKGDRIGLLIEPGIEAIVSMIAITYAGAVVMPLFSGFGAEPISSRLSLCRARALIATAGFKRRGKLVDREAVAREAVKSAGTELLILKPLQGDKASGDGVVDWNDVAAGPEAGPKGEPMSSQDMFMIFFTSGTTGLPKGIVHTHGTFPMKVMHDGVICFDMKRDDIFFWPADMGWVAGALAIATALMRGATMMCYDGAPDYPDWSRMSRFIERYKVTHFGGAPTMIRGFAANEKLATAGDMSSIRLLITGGEAIDPEHFAWYGRHFGGGVAPVINFSGGTEVCGGLVGSVMHRPIVPGGFNTAVPGMEVDVVDAEGNSIRNAVGELVVRSPGVGMTSSFWEDDERYLDTYWRTIPGIWVHGDLAILDDDGNFFLRGRSDDTLKLAGKRTGPAEIEDVLMEMPEIVEVAAIGVDDPAKGQVLVVFAIAPSAADDQPAFAQKVMDHADARLGRAFRPNKVHVVRELPKTRTAKVMRRLIRGAYSGLPLGDISALDNPSALEEIARVAKAG